MACVTDHDVTDSVLLSTTAAYTKCAQPNSLCLNPPKAPICFSSWPLNWSSYELLMQENTAVVTRLTPHLEHTIHAVKCAGENPGARHNVIHCYYSVHKKSPQISSYVVLFDYSVVFLTIRSHPNVATLAWPLTTFQLALNTFLCILGIQWMDLRPRIGLGM
jgi:hypothetical protein